MVKSNKMKLSFTNLDRIYVVFIFVIIIIFIIIIINNIIITIIIFLPCNEVKRIEITYSSKVWLQKFSK